MPRHGRAAARLDLVLAGVGALAALLLLMLPDGPRSAVAGGLRATVLAPLLGLEARSARVRAALRGRDTVLVRAGGEVRASADAAAMEAENRTLRDLLGLAGRLRQGFVVADLLPGRSFEADFTLGLDAGAESGIAPFQPVVTARGLVGMVERVDARRSEVITWAHPDFAASAMSADGSAFGIIKPHLAPGARRFLLELRGVRYRSRLDTGTVVVTSGLGATFPRGIVIGAVVGELATPEQWSRTYLVLPAVLPDGVGPVVVLTPSSDTGRVASAWRGGAVDSAARAAAAAGDSLARTPEAGAVPAASGADPRLSDSGSASPRVRRVLLPRPDTGGPDAQVPVSRPPQPAGVPWR
ncbi:MAG: rod shape-determining protein MreC [Gemmatimonadetes bacterium]|nr:rod shape-determining protein MreC [Gemmatimonadota bacterium]